MKTGSQEVSGSRSRLSPPNKKRHPWGVFFCLTEVLRIVGHCAAMRGSLRSAAGAEHAQREYPAYLHQKKNDGNRRRFVFFVWSIGKGETCRIFHENFKRERLYRKRKVCYTTTGHVKNMSYINAPVAQLDRVSDSDVSGPSS